MDMSRHPQSLGMECLSNARELGGYPVQDGRRVRRGALLRSGALIGASEQDLKWLTEVYHVGVIADFRSLAEMEDKPDPELPGAVHCPLPVLGAEDMAGHEKEILSDQMYIYLLSAPNGIRSFRTFLEQAAGLPEGKALLFHCTQGKDRTGIASMLLLSVLGADLQTIMDDYLLTNQFNEKLIEQGRSLLASIYPPEKVEQYMSFMEKANWRFMHNALEWMQAQFGSVCGYVEQQLGIPAEMQAQIREKYLVEA